MISKPISVINNKCSRQTRIVKFRPFPQSGLERMKSWLIDETWQNVYNASSAHEKASIFQDMLISKLNEFFPLKTRKIQSDDQPWVTHKIKLLDRRRKRIYRKERKSQKWYNLDKMFKKEVKSAKEAFYEKNVSELKLKKPGQWYACLKKLSSYDQLKNDQPIVEEISHLSDQEQCEAIAQKFSSIPNEYAALSTDDVHVPQFHANDVPQFNPAQVWLSLSRLDVNKATVDGDFPARLTKLFAAYLAEPLTDIFNTGLLRGQYPDIYKFEVCTPVPKMQPTQTMGQLRNISGLFNFDKVFEKLISQLILSDMHASLDPAQFGNQKGLSIQHYLIQMIHRILSALDNNSKGDIFAVVANMIDWNNAFPRQCPKLGVESFLRNGVRPSLIPILTNYFQN